MKLIGGMHDTKTLISSEVTFLISNGTSHYSMGPSSGVSLISAGKQDDEYFNIYVLVFLVHCMNARFLGLVHV